MQAGDPAVGVDHRQRGTGLVGGVDRRGDGGALVLGQPVEAGQQRAEPVVGAEAGGRQRVRM